MVSASVVSLRLENRAVSQVSKGWFSSWHEGVICLLTIAICGFIAGLCYRFGLSYIFSLVAVVIALIAFSALQFRHVSLISSFVCAGKFSIFFSTTRIVSFRLKGGKEGLVFHHLSFRSFMCAKMFRMFCNKNLKLGPKKEEAAWQSLPKVLT